MNLPPSSTALEPTARAERVAPAGAPPRVVLVAAVARNGAIGRGNALVWRDREDQRHFRRSTLGATVLMGRRTWDSLPERFRPLPDRRNLVLTRQTDWQADGAEPVASIDAAVALAAGAGRLAVIGGAELYRLALPRADALLLTEIDADLDADTFFPAWDRSAFDLESADPRTDADGRPYRFATYRRRSS